MDSEFHMWSYWRDKKGIVEALGYYPATVKANPNLQQALYAIAAAEALINQTMENLPDQEPE